MFKKTIYLLCILVICISGAVPLSAQIPGMISYQARIVDESTGPVNDTRTISFTIYAQAEGGTPLWSEDQNVTIVNGLVNVMLGSVKPLTSEIFQSDERYLGVKIGSESEMKPRKRLLAVPYALRAESGTIRITPSGGISSTDVTSAIKELDAEKLSLMGGTLSGRLNIYNIGANDVGVDALSADSAAIQAMNRGSGAPAMVAYNFGNGDGMYSFAETGNALWAINNSDNYVTLYAENKGNSNVLKSYSNCEYPNIYAENGGNGGGIYSFSKSGTGISAYSEADNHAAIYAENKGNGPSIYTICEHDAPTIDARNLGTGGGTGVYGYSNTGTGVYGFSDGSNSGVYGYSKSGHGVTAINDGDDYSALYAKNNGANVAIWAEAGDNNGIYVKNTSDNHSTLFAQAEGENTAIYGYSKKEAGGTFKTDATGYWAVYIYAANKSPNNAGLRVDGYATITGGVSSTILTSAGKAKTHTITSPQAEFSFSGSTRLSGGEAEVNFAQTWQDCISNATEYRVLITPTEMCNGICCLEKTPSGFKVKELMNGTSNASFDWMVRAVQKGSSTEKVLLAGAGKPDVGMEIIDESEEGKMMQTTVEKPKGKNEVPVSQSPDLSGVQAPKVLVKQPQPVEKASREMEQRIKQVMEYKEKLKQRAQGK